MLTHRRQTNIHPKETGFVVLFAEDGNEGYGEYVWTLKTDLPDVSQGVVDFARKFYQIDREEAEDLVNPENIVSSAGAWDDPDFVSELWQSMESGEVPLSVGFRTEDGAVVLDPYEVDLTLEIEDEEY